MYTARKLFLKLAVLTVALACISSLSACQKPQGVAEGPGGGGPPPKKATIGACSLTWSDANCDDSNQCLSGTCTVNVVANGGSATAKIQGKNPVSPKDKIICVKSGTSPASLQWQSPPASVGGTPNQFVGDFGGISPWQSARAFVVGGGSTSDTETAASSATKCFKYDLFVCNSATSTGSTVSCGMDDPIIIVGD